MSRLRRLLLSALVLAAGLAVAVVLLPWDEEIAGRAVAMDGDSLRVDGVEIRLEGVDAPELAQTCERNGEPWKCGREARARLADLVQRQIVTCRVVGRDRYRRRLARCAIAGEDIGALLVGEGWAVGYGAYHRQEWTARWAVRGLWGGTFERPSDWRKARAAQVRP